MLGHVSERSTSQYFTWRLLPLLVRGTERACVRCMYMAPALAPSWGDMRCTRGRLVTAYAEAAVEAKPPAAARAAAAAAAVRAARATAPPTGGAGHCGARHGVVAGAPSAGQQRVPAGRERAPVGGGPARPAAAAADDLVELEDEDEDAGWTTVACGGATARAVQVVRERGARPPARARIARCHP